MESVMDALSKIALEYAKLPLSKLPENTKYLCMKQNGEVIAMGEPWEFREVYLFDIDPRYFDIRKYCFTSEEIYSKLRELSEVQIHDDTAQAAFSCYDAWI